MNDPRTIHQKLRKDDVKQVECWFSDIYGFLKAFAIPLSQLTVDETGEQFAVKGFDGSSIPGMAPLQDSDVLAQPDLSVPRRLPWDNHSVAFHCDLYDVTQAPYENDIRHRLKNLVQNHSKHQFSISAKLEFYLLKPKPQTGEKPFSDSDRGGYFDLASIRIAESFMDRIMIAAQTMSIAIQQYHHEAENSQFGIYLSPQGPVKTADDLITVRHLIRRLAREQGLMASFYPKPFADREGSALKFCICIAHIEDGRCAFSEISSRQTLLPFGKSFLAGLQYYGRQTMLLSNQWVNSYKRLRNNFRAPLYLASSEHFNETSVQINVCGSRDQQCPQKGFCIAHADAACNPCLALLGYITSGMAGQSPDDFKLWNKQEALKDAAKKGEITRMPDNLQQAIDDFESGHLMRPILGPALIDTLIDIKRQEAQQFEKFVTRWEQERQLGVL